MRIATSGSKVDISEENLTAKFAKQFSKILRVGDVVLLHGEIGTGKTTFVKYLINSLEKQKKLNLSEITSPTFSILNEFKIKDIIFRHFDLFRIRSFKEIENLGIFENISDSITFIEWPERIEKKIKNKFNIYFDYNSKLEKRFIEINKVKI
tara:strand:- start:128 stop:583 length:456 start_codon:yes stop_codon:yes gene_type:complete